jgi:four helix bundle protein
MTARSFRDLIVWQRAFALADQSCAIADSLRRNRRSGLATQIERAAASIPANIAEGNGRYHRGDYLHHLSIASGSLAELESHLLLAQALERIDREPVHRALGLAREVGRMLGGLIRALRVAPEGRS